MVGCAVSGASGSNVWFQVMTCGGKLNEIKKLEDAFHDTTQAGQDVWW